MYFDMPPTVSSVDYKQYGDISLVDYKQYGDISMVDWKMVTFHWMAVKL